VFYKRRKTKSKATVTTNKSLKELNSQNIEIKSTLFEYDSLGLLQRELTKYSLSPARVDKRYTYNENGQVSNLSIATIQNTKNFKFIYDRLSSLKSIEYYLEDKLVSTYEIVYNSNGWVSALLKHDLTSQLIEIEELEYSFYK